MKKLEDSKLSNVAGGAIMGMVRTHFFSEEIGYLKSKPEDFFVEEGYTHFKVRHKDGSAINNNFELVALLKDMPEWCGVLITLQPGIFSKGFKNKLMSLGVPKNKIFEGIGETQNFFWGGDSHGKA